MRKDEKIVVFLFTNNKTFLEVTMGVASGVLLRKEEKWLYRGFMRWGIRNKKRAFSYQENSTFAVGCFQIEDNHGVFRRR